MVLDVAIRDRIVLFSATPQVNKHRPLVNAPISGIDNNVHLLTGAHAFARFFSKKRPVFINTNQHIIIHYSYSVISEKQETIISYIYTGLHVYFLLQTS